MFKYIVGIVLLITSSSAISSNINTNGLTPNQIAEIQLQVEKAKNESKISKTEELIFGLETAGRMGKEVGIAVSSGLEAVVDVSNKFSTTPVGKITIALIVWKFIGQSFVLLILGITGFITGIYLFKILSLPRKTVLEYENIPVFGGLYIRKVPKQIEEQNAHNFDAGVISLAIGTIILMASLVNV